MKTLIFLLLIFICYSNGSISLEDELKLEKELIEFKTSTTSARYLETEENTCDLAMSVLRNFRDDIGSFLDSAFSEIWSSLEVTYDTRDSKNGMCLNGTVEKIKVFIEKELTDFNVVAKDVELKLESLNIDVKSKMIQLYSRKQMTIRGLENCYNRHPAANQKVSRDSCIDIYKVYFQNIEDELALIHAQSPCMTLIQDEILVGITDISVRIKEHMEMLLTKLLCPEESKEETLCLNTLPPMPSFQPYLTEQVKQAQDKYNSYSMGIDEMLSDYFGQEYKTKKDSNLNLRNEDEFALQLTKEMEPDFNRIKQVILDYPENGGCSCSRDVLRHMNFFIEEAGKNSSNCFNTLITETTAAMESIRTYFLEITEELKHQGNVDILRCMNRKNIFHPNFILDCCNFYFLIGTWHTNKILKNIKDTREKLDSLIQHVEDNGNTLPCMVEIQEMEKFAPDAMISFYKYCSGGICLESSTPSPQYGVHYTTNTTEVWEHNYETTVIMDYGGEDGN